MELSRYLAKLSLKTIEAITRESSQSYFRRRRPKQQLITTNNTKAGVVNLPGDKLRLVPTRVSLFAMNIEKHLSCHQTNPPPPHPYPRRHFLSSNI